MKELIAKHIAKHFKSKLSEKEALELIEVPPSSKLGDYSFPCFSIAKKIGETPAETATELAAKFPKIPEIDRVEIKGSYVNFFINKSLLAQQVLSINSNFGREHKKPERVMIEFCQANTHKAFHVGHIRGTSIGESLARILEFSGKKVFRANYQGDSGMHVAKWLWCYLKYHRGEEIKKDDKWIADIYVEAVRKLSENEKFEKEAEKINKKLDEGKDKKLVELWKETRKASLDEFEKIYKDLGTRFDYYFFESEVEKRAKEISRELLKKKIAIKSEGAVIVNLEKYNLGVWVLLRKDGTPLYSAKDLALAEKKFREIKISKSIYVVGAAQRLHMYQLFKTLELMKFKQAKKCAYVPLLEVRLPEGKIASRTGENIIYSEFKREIIDCASAELKKRYPKLKKEEMEKRALAISVAAIKYAMLKQDLDKTIIFSKEESLNFEGNTGPYLQYSYARASSILKKAKSKKTAKTINLDSYELALIKELLKFPEIVDNAESHLSPSIIANYAFQLAQTFNEFYHSCPVIGSGSEAFRLELVNKFRIVMASSLSLLGIEVLEEM